MDKVLSARTVQNDNPQNGTLQPKTSKFLQKQGNLKMMMFAYDIHGILTAQQVPMGQTVE